MSDKKRKRPDAADADLRPSKRQQSLIKSNNIKLNVVQSLDEFLPVLLNTNGIVLPHDARFAAYSKQSDDNTRRELFIHSDAHSEVDYQARSLQGLTADSNLQHYVGVFDPQSNELVAVKVHQMSLKTSLRSERDMGLASKDDLPEAPLSQRQKLGMEFGTKKAKKAIEDLSRNIISPNKPKATPHDTSSLAKKDPVTAALLESMATSAKNAPTKDMLQAAVNAARPVPIHNPDAEFLPDVYPIKEIVGSDMLDKLQVKPWIDAINTGKEVETESRFVTKRLVELIKTKNIQKIKALRFMLLLIGFFNAIGGSKRGRKALPKRDVLQKRLQVDDSLLEIVRNRFTADSSITSWHIDNLITHIAVLSLIVDDFHSDIYDLVEDLNLKTSRVTKYFTEIGARTAALTEAEQRRASLSKEAASNHRIAKLVLPLQFPQQRTVGPRRRR